MPTRVAKNRVHLDVAPDADDDQAAEVERLLSLGAIRVDIGQGEQTRVVLADPVGNELCVLGPRSSPAEPAAGASGSGPGQP